jgi:hypothetical protein
MNRLHGVWLVVLGVGLACSGCRGCGARGGQTTGREGLVTGSDGAVRYEVYKGQVQAYYDRWGRLVRLEVDSNRDGMPDRISHHKGQKQPTRVDVDTDFDARIDRWEYYEGVKLVKVGAARRGGGPDMWQVLDDQGRVVRREYDDDHTGKVNRIEVVDGGRVTLTEVDSDRDGRIDRWQHWSQGRLTSEELDTAGDGKPDRVVLYGSDGKIAGTRRLNVR